MLEKAMRVTVNSDYPAYFPGYMKEKFIATQREAGLSKEQVVQLSTNAFEGNLLSITWLSRKNSINLTHWYFAI